MLGSLRCSGLLYRRLLLLYRLRLSHRLRGRLRLYRRLHNRLRLSRRLLRLYILLLYRRLRGSGLRYHRHLILNSGRHIVIRQSIFNFFFHNRL